MAEAHLKVAPSETHLKVAPSGTHLKVAPSETHLKVAPSHPKVASLETHRKEKVAPADLPHDLMGPDLLSEGFSFDEKEDDGEEDVEKKNDTLRVLALGDDDDVEDDPKDAVDDNKQDEKELEREKDKRGADQRQADQRGADQRGEDLKQEGGRTRREEKAGQEKDGGLDEREEGEMDPSESTRLDGDSAHRGHEQTFGARESKQAGEEGELVLLGFGLRRSTSLDEIKKAFASYELVSVLFPPSSQSRVQHGSRPAIATLTFAHAAAAARALREMHRQLIDGARVRLEYPTLKRSRTHDRRHEARDGGRGFAGKVRHSAAVERSPHLVCFNLAVSAPVDFLCGLFLDKGGITVSAVAERGSDSRRMVFLECGSTTEAQRAIDLFHKSIIDKQVLRIEFARQQPACLRPEPPAPGRSDERVPPRSRLSTFSLASEDSSFRRQPPRRDRSPRGALPPRRDRSPHVAPPPRRDRSPHVAHSPLRDSRHPYSPRRQSPQHSLSSVPGSS